MFSFFRRRKEADATARRIIDQGRFLGARTPREAVEMLWGRRLSQNEWVRNASVWERIWGESLKERPIESEMRPPYQLRLAILAVTDEPLSGKNATENTANAVALLTTAIVKKTVSTIADDDDRFVAGIFVFVFSDYFTLVLPGNFEEASTLAMMKVLGIKEFHRGFDTLWESYNELVRSRPKILEGISEACEAWFKHPGASEFERLVELFELARTHVVKNNVGEGLLEKFFGARNSLGIRDRAALKREERADDEPTSARARACLQLRRMIAQAS